MKGRRVARTLGTIFKLYGLLLLFPILASLYWDEGVAASGLAADVGLVLKVTTVSFFLTMAFIVLLGFVLTTLAGDVVQELREREAFFIVGAGWLLCAVLGSIPFILTGATRDPTVAFFEAMSAVTTTGYTALSAPLERYPESVHVWRGALHLFGGLGIVVVLVAIISRLTEGAHRLMTTETAGGDASRLRPRLTQTAKTIAGIYLTLVVLTFFALWFALRYTAVDPYTWKESGFHALVHALGVHATGGMSTRTDSIAGFGSGTVNTIVFVGIFLGGTQFAIYYYAISRGWRAFWDNTEWRFYLLVILGASVLVITFLMFDGRSLGYSLAYGPHTVLTTLTTAGYTATDTDAFPDAAKLVLIFLMFTGAMVGSTTGGIKLYRILILLRLCYREIAKLLHPHAVSVVKVGGRIFPEESLRRIVVFFFTFVSIFIAGAIGFALLGLDFQTSITASISTLANIGYGYWGVADGFGDPLGHFPPGARLLGSMLMWLGRLEIFAVLLLFVPATYRD